MDELLPPPQNETDRNVAAKSEHDWGRTELDESDERQASDRWGSDNALDDEQTGEHAVRSGHGELRPPPGD
jgi:hypothetical protein